MTPLSFFFVFEWYDSSEQFLDSTTIYTDDFSNVQILYY